MNKEIIPVKIEYSNSLEKWKGIRKFAELNDIDTSKIDAMITRIKKVGDVSLNVTFTFEISRLEDLFNSIYNGDEHPCPHCIKHEFCNGCPLTDDSLGCCKEWGEVRQQMMDYL